MSYHLYVIIVHSIVTLICGSFAGLAFFQLRHDSLGRAFFVLMVFETGAAFCTTLIRFFYLAGQSIWIPFYVGVVFYVALPSTLLAFAAEYFQVWTPALRRFSWFILLDIPLGFVLIVTDKFLKSIAVAPDGMLVYPYQPLGIVCLAIGEAGALVSLVLVLKEFRTARGPRRQMAWGFIVMVVGMLLVAVQPIYRWTGTIFYAVTVLLMTGPVLQQRLFDPLAQANTRLARRNEQQELITIVGQHATSLLDRNVLLTTVAQDIQRAFNYYGVAIWLPIESRGLSLCATANGPAPEIPRANDYIRINMSTLVGAAAMTHIIAYVRDVKSDRRYQSSKFWHETRSALCIPLVLGSSQNEEILIGVLEIQDRRVEAFTADDLAILQILGRHLAIAIRNAQLFEDVQAARQGADEASAAKTGFISYISHEIKNPINGILEITDMILRLPELYSVPLPEAYQENIEDIEQLGRHLQRLMGDILDLSRIEAGKLNITKKAINPVPVLRQVQQAVSGSLHDGVTLEANYPERLPAILADELRLRQIIMNLVNNAAKFTKHGSIRLDAQRQDGCLCFSVADTGPGIASEAISKLFRAYAQASTDIVYEYGGTGLGLNICKQLVELQSGRIWVESHEGQGTTFYFTMPLAAMNTED